MPIRSIEVKREVFVGQEGVRLGDYICARCDQHVEIAFDVIDGLQAGDSLFVCLPQKESLLRVHQILHSLPKNCTDAAYRNVAALGLDQCRPR